jgi:ubiquinone/menaquinone biosynthesis C-methylase UbiE
MEGRMVVGAKKDPVRERPPIGTGDLEDEVKRLELRATFLRDLTEDAVRQAGIGRGMRVLDLGCDSGDTSLLIAKLVGPSGLVVGVDPSEEAIDFAERCATVAGQCYWARFISADLNAFVPAEPFDAVVLRLNRRRPPKPAATLLELSVYVRPQGVIVFVSG